MDSDTSITIILCTLFVCLALIFTTLIYFEYNESEYKECLSSCQYEDGDYKIDCIATCGKYFITDEANIIKNVAVSEVSE